MQAADRKRRRVASECKDSDKQQKDGNKEMYFHGTSRSSRHKILCQLPVCHLESVEARRDTDFAPCAAMCYNACMSKKRSVGVRELRQNLSVYLRRVKQ